MQPLHLPLTGASRHIINRKIAMGLVQLPELTGQVYHNYRGTRLWVPPAPAQRVPVILALYHAHAYPPFYYNQPLQIDVNPTIDI